MKISVKIMVALYVFFSASFVISAPLKVKVTSGNFTPTPIAIMPFYNPSKISKIKQVSDDMRDIVINNLVNTGLFESVSQQAFLETVVEASTQPDFTRWSAIRTDILVTVKTSQENQRYVFFVNVWDVNQGIGLFSRKYKVSSLQSHRRLSHIISDDIYSRITGEKPYFDSQILYVAETKGTGNKVIKRLAIMDQDGANIQYLTDGKRLVLTPRFSPNGKYMTYLSYKGKTAGIFIRNRQTGQQKFLSTVRNVSYAPRFSPDSKSMIFSFMDGGSSDIWVMWLEQAGYKFDRLTKTPDIDTTPFYSPDGKNIVFVSDRTGSPQLYTMRADGTNVKRISYGDGAYTTPVWSPRGDIIAFTKQQGQTFHIGVMYPDGSGERLLTGSYLDEGPTFSPNGRVIIFFRQEKDTGKVYLMSVDITGHNLRIVSTPTNASDPNWSTLRSR